MEQTKLDAANALMTAIGCACTRRIDVMHGIVCIEMQTTYPTNRPIIFGTIKTIVYEPNGTGVTF